MQYMLMCCIDEYAWGTLPDSQKDKIMREYGALIQDLVKSGQFRGGGQLHLHRGGTVTGGCPWGVAPGSQRGAMSYRGYG